uniref:Uncharacterized protein n=1 Tax=Nicotiana tabacum TaxID=4097 RepID=A0A1S3Z9T0_TOBAC
MGSKWAKVKLALGLNLCTYIPRTLDNDDDDEDSSSSVSDPEKNSGAALISPATADIQLAPPATVPHGSKLSKSFSRSSKCIVSNVKHGNQICPVCRAKWKEIPVHFPSLDTPLGRARINPVDWPQNNALTTVTHRPPVTRPTPNRHISPLFQAPEPAIFNDDEPVGQQVDSTDKSASHESSIDACDSRAVKIETFPEVPAVPRSIPTNNFSVLVHLKAPGSVSVQDPCRNQANLPKVSHTPRAPVDLVTVIDVSGSMAGTKLALLKRAMGFVIQNLGPSDRLA